MKGDAIHNCKLVCITFWCEEIWQHKRHKAVPGAPNNREGPKRLQGFSNGGEENAKNTVSASQQKCTPQIQHPVSSTFSSFSDLFLISELLSIWVHSLKLFIELKPRNWFYVVQLLVFFLYSVMWNWSPNSHIISTPWLGCWMGSTHENYNKYV